MRYNKEISTSKCRRTKGLNKHRVGQKIEKYITANLRYIGRKQPFYHYPHSELPIRDITCKTEPHIEIGAENYIRCCIQPNIRGFCRSTERFLFLCTKCENRKLREHFGKRYVVGYIEKKVCKIMNDARLTVIGKTYVIPFDRRLDYQVLGFMGKSYTKKLNNTETILLLTLIHSRKNILKKCIREMVEKEKEERIRKTKIPIDIECLKNFCDYKDICFRKRL